MDQREYQRKSLAAAIIAERLTHGSTYRKIADKLKISQTTASKVFNYFLETGSFIPSKKRPKQV